MSWMLLVTMAILLVAVVLIEIRAVREGDERRRHAPGYALTLVGLVAIAIGIAAAISDQGLVALVLASAGLVTVALGATRHDLVVMR
jgi:hypothetical protein